MMRSFNLGSSFSSRWWRLDRFVLTMAVFFVTTTSIAHVNAQARGIPGSTQTISGYDTEMGEDPICWTSVNAAKYANDSEVYPFPNPLVANFSIAGQISLKPACPMGNSITAYAPANRELINQVNDSRASSLYKTRLRTGTNYTYKIHATFNLTSLGEPYFVSDTGPTVAFQIVLCINGVSGFCSPFIHEEANERIIRNQNGNETLPTVPGGAQHGGTHVHSPKILRNLTWEEGPYYELDVDVDVLVNDPADFYAIAAVQFFVGRTPDDIELRYDMANALVDSQRLITYQAPAKVLEVPSSVLVFCHVCRGLTAAVILFLLVQTIQHRHHQVLKLSQYSFLVVFLGAALAATLGTVLLEPRNDFYCRWSKTFVLVPLQLMLAVTTGRMWRIASVISPLLVKTLRQQESWEMRLIHFLMCRRRNSDKAFKNLRKEFKPEHLTVFVCVVTAVQVLIQLAAALWQEDTLDIDYNYDVSTGRLVCTNDADVGHSVFLYGFYVFVLLMMAMLAMAHATRHLPSLFNETEVIFNTALSSLLVLGLGVAILIITDGPTTSPAIAYLTWCFQVFCLTLNATCRIMIPKLAIVWRGETVFVSKLVAEHARTTREDNEVYLSRKGDGSGSTTVRVTGLDMTGNKTGKSKRNFGQQRTESNSMDLASDMKAFQATSAGEASTTEGEVMEQTTGSGGVDRKEGDHTEISNSTPSTSNERADLPVKKRVGFNDTTTTVQRTPSLPQRTMKGYSQKSGLEHILIRQEESPSKRLILKMYNLQAQLVEVNQQIMSGRSVPKKEWERLRRMSTRLGDTFHNVSFDWDNENTQLIGEEEDEEPFPDEEENVTERFQI